MMTLSRTMRLADYDELRTETADVDKVAAEVGGMDLSQHRHRLWEYALALRAYQEWWVANERESKVHRIADVGCGIGLLAPLMKWMNNDVVMYEPWVYGDQSEQALRQMSLVSGGSERRYELRNRCLCDMTEEDRNFDAAFCISTLEHIGKRMRAFEDLLEMVRVGGLVFLTLDYADDDWPDEQYVCHWMRPTGMPRKKDMDELFLRAASKGFMVMGGIDWVWDESCRLVANHGFASLALLKVGNHPMVRVR